MTPSPDNLTFLHQQRAKYPDQAGVIERFAQQIGLSLPTHRDTPSEPVAPVVPHPHEKIAPPLEGTELIAAVSAHRQSLGLTQAEFAARLGISLRTYQEWEQGRRRPSGPAACMLRYALPHQE